MLNKSEVDELKKAKSILDEAEMIVVGAGAGLSAAAGLKLDKEVIDVEMPEYGEKYGIQDLYSGMFYPFQSKEKTWAFWARAIYYVRYKTPSLSLYDKLYRYLQKRDYFVITTNCDGQFDKNNFPAERIFHAQGDYGEFVCSNSCTDRRYSSKKILENMINHTKDFSVDRSMIPKCPICGKDLGIRIRSGTRCLEDSQYLEEQSRYFNFLSKTKNKRTVFLELGVGYNTPTIIKIPFWGMVSERENSYYMAVNLDNPYILNDIVSQTLYVRMPIENAADVLFKNIEK